MSHSASFGGGGFEDDNGGDSDSLPFKVPSKHGKGKSKGKVWQKVNWFSRRSRSRDLPSELAAVPYCEAAIYPNDVMDLDLSPTHSASGHSAIISKSWLESSSSSENELYENEDGYLVKRSRLYPNSEIIEQHCLKPSVARALFLQMEAANHRNGRLQKYSWQRKKKKGCGLVQNDQSFASGMDSLSRAVSMPSGITSKSKCHCRACCSCTPGEILQGMCPAHVCMSTSTTSLDTGLSNLEDMKCEFMQQNGGQELAEYVDQAMPSPATTYHDCPSPSEVTKPPHKLPNYYSQSLQRKCKNCGEVIRQSPGPIFDSGVLPSLPSQAIFCQCRHGLQIKCDLPDTQEAMHTGGATAVTASGIGLLKDRVESLQFKSRLDVSFLASSVPLKGWMDRGGRHAIIVSSSNKLTLLSAKQLLSVYHPALCVLPLSSILLQFF